MVPWPLQSLSWRVWEGIRLAEPKGRPKTLVRRHVLEIKEDTQEWIEEQITRVLTIQIAGKAARTLGEVIKGAVSHPVGYLGVSVVLAGFTIWITRKKEERTRAIQDATTGFLKLTPDERTAVHQGIKNVVGFLEFHTQPPPPGEGAPIVV